MDKNVPWKCRNCETVLGYLDQNCEVIRIKVRDVYVYVTGGAVSVTCRKCGTMNGIDQTQRDDLKSTKVKLQRG